MKVFSRFNAGPDLRRGPFPGDTLEITMENFILFPVEQICPRLEVRNPVQFPEDNIKNVFKDQGEGKSFGVELKQQF